MKVYIPLPQPRTVELRGRRSVQSILRELGFNPEAVLVIKGGTLLTADTMVEEEDEVEVRPAISGGEGP